MSKATDDVLAERQRQIEAEGWTADHDDAHGIGARRFVVSSPVVWRFHGPQIQQALGGGDAILTGSAFASASSDRSPQRFAAVRAARDAEIRAARQLAELIRTRVAAGLAAKA